MKHQPQPPKGSPAYDQQLVVVENLKLYETREECYILDLPYLRTGVTRTPRAIPKIMIEHMVMTEDGSLVAQTYMERWVAEQNGFKYEVVTDVHITEMISSGKFLS